MKLFSNKNKTVEKSQVPEHFIRCEPGSVVLANANPNAISIIKNLVSVPNNIFDNIYVQTLYRLAEFCQALPLTESEKPYSRLVHQLNNCIATLKRRRGALLPPNADAEDIAQQEPQWTYAIFTAALFYQLDKLITDKEIALYDENENFTRHWHWLAGSLYEPKGYYAKTEEASASVDASLFITALVLQIIPPRAMQWLTQNKLLLQQWYDTLLGKQSNNLIEKLILQAIEPKALSENHQNQKALEGPLNSAIPTDTEVENTATKAESVETHEKSTIIKLLEFIKVNFNNTDEFINWLRVEEGLLIRVSGLEAFIEQANSWKSIEDFIQANSENLLPKNETFKVRYRPKAYQDRRIIEGILIKETCLDEHWKGMPINEIFQPALKL